MASLIGSILGSNAQNSTDSQANGEQAQALQNILALNTPSIEEQQLALQNEQSAGQINPTLEQAQQQQNTSLNNVSVNPQLRAAQMQALQSLQQQGQTGLTPQDKVALTQISQQNAQQANSANQATLQNAAARGMGGSGASLAAQLANNQNSANNAQNQSLQVGAQGAQSALNATAQAGQLGGQMENAQYGEASNAARAQDAINQFNTANKQGVNAQNTLAQNQAQAYNLQNAQNISNTNTNLANQQQQYNKGLYQTQYNNQLGQQEAAAGEANSLAGNQNKQGVSQNQNMQNIANGAGSAATSIAGYVAGDPGMSEGGIVPAPKPMHPIKLFRMLSPTGHNNMYADGGVVSDPLTTQQKLALIQKGANVLAQQPTQVPQYTSNGIGAEDAASLGQEQTANPNMSAQWAKFQAAHANDGANGYARGGLIDYPGIPQPHVMPMPQNYTSGGPVKGPEIVPGDSPKNDVVNAKLSGGELVIPKEINESNNDAVIMAFIKGAKTAGRR